MLQPKCQQTVMYRNNAICFVLKGPRSGYDSKNRLKKPARCIFQERRVGGLSAGSFSNFSPAPSMRSSVQSWLAHSPDIAERVC